MPVDWARWTRGLLTWDKLTLVGTIAQAKSNNILKTLSRNLLLKYLEVLTGADIVQPRSDRYFYNQIKKYTTPVETKLNF